MVKKVSIATVLKILNQSDRKYTVSEAELIRDYLYDLANLQVEWFLETQKSNK